MQPLQLIRASTNLVSIDDPVASYSQEIVAVSLPLEEAPIMHVDVEFPISVKTMCLQRWVSWIAGKEAKLLVKFLADRGWELSVRSLQFFGEDNLYLLSHLIASEAFRKDFALPSAMSLRPLFRLC